MQASASTIAAPLLLDSPFLEMRSRLARPETAFDQQPAGNLNRDVFTGSTRFPPVRWIEVDRIRRHDANAHSFTKGYAVQVAGSTGVHGTGEDVDAGYLNGLLEQPVPDVHRTQKSPVLRRIGCPCDGNFIWRQSIET